MKEIWKVWKDSRGKGPGALWEVSNLGRVKKNGRLFEAKPDLISGYLRVAGNYVHKMVALLFIPNPENKPQVDHIDTNRLNNKVDNLRWVTPSENMNNPLTQQRMSASLKGKPLSEEHKQKLSDMKKGKPSVNKGKHWYKDPTSGTRIYY